MEQRKIREARFLCRFLELQGLAGLIPLVRAHEAPDFIITRSNGQLGIEVREVVNHTQLNTGVTGRAQEGKWSAVVNAAAAAWAKSQHPNVYVQLIFNDRCHIPKARISSLSREIAEAVARFLPEENQQVSVHRAQLPPGEFPQELHGFLVFHGPQFKQSHWHPGLAGWVAQLTAEQIQTELHAKEGKVEGYRAECDEVWLLLVVDQLKPSSGFELHAEAREAQYWSTFDQAFVIETARETVCRLNLDRVAA